MSFLSDIWHKVWDVLKTIIAVAAIIFVLVVAWYAVMAAAAYGAVAEAALTAILPQAAVGTIAAFAGLAAAYPAIAAFAAVAVISIASPALAESIVTSIVSTAEAVVDGLVDVAAHLVSEATSGFGWVIALAATWFLFSRNNDEGDLHVSA